MSGIENFKKSIENFKKEVPKQFHVNKKEIAFDLFSRFTKGNPVGKGSGRSRASWNISVNEIDKSYKPEGNYPDPNIPNVNDGPFDTIYITNSVPYIVALEDGHSGQAPDGFVALSIDAVVEGLKNGF